jgi:hypothetical protein
MFLGFGAFSGLFLLAAVSGTADSVSATGSSNGSSETGDNDPNRWWKRLLFIMGGVTMLSGAIYLAYCYSGVTLGDNISILESSLDKPEIISDVGGEVIDNTLAVLSDAPQQLSAEAIVPVGDEIMLSGAHAATAVVAAGAAVVRSGLTLVASDIVEEIFSEHTVSAPAVSLVYEPYDERFFTESISEVLKRSDLSVLDRGLIDLVLATVGGDSQWSLTEFFHYSFERVMDSRYAITEGGHFVYKESPLSASLLAFGEPNGRGGFMSPLINSLLRRCPPEGLKVLMELDEKLWEIREEALRRYASQYESYIHDLLLKIEDDEEEIEAISLALRCLFSDWNMMFLIFDKFEELKNR